MLFTCQICLYGHSALNVEQFKNRKTKKTIYLCKSHLKYRTKDLIHMPWLSSDDKECTICGPSEQCYGKNQQPGIKIYGRGKQFAIERIVERIVE